MIKLLVASLSIAFASSAFAADGSHGADAAQAHAPPMTTAPSAERIELARRFIASTVPADTMAQSMLAGAQQVALQTIADEGERADAQEQMDRLFIRLQPALRQAMPDFLEKYAQVYATEFSADELRQLITFAESPAGRHYTAQAVSLQNDPLLQEAQAELWDKLSPVMDDFNKERCAKRAAQRIAAGDAKAKCPLAAKSEQRPS